MRLSHLLMTAFGTAALFATSAGADVTLSIGDRLVPTSPTAVTNGSVNVLLDVNGDVGGTAPLLASFNARVDVSSGGVSVGTLTLSGATNSLLGGSPATPATGAFLRASDDAATGSEMSLADGQTLMTLQYQFSAAATGLFDLDFNAGETFLFDQNGDPSALTLDGGTLTAAVPEPATAGLFLFAGLLLSRRARRQV